MHGRSDSAWSCFCSRRHSCAPPTGTSACTSRGHLRRVHVLAERLQDMHDANYTGKKASQPQVHAWFVFDRDYCGPATINPVSIHQPAARMPWAQLPARDNGNGYHGKRGTSRHYVLTRLARDGRTDLAAQVEAGGLSVRAALRQLRGGGQT